MGIDPYCMTGRHEHKHKYRILCKNIQADIITSTGQNNNKKHSRRQHGGP